MPTPSTLLRTAMYTFSSATQNPGIGSDSVSKDLASRVVFYVKGKDFIKMNFSALHNCLFSSVYQDLIFPLKGEAGENRPIKG